MSGTTDVSFFLAFLAGLLSFLSPCVLPLVPSYLTFIVGISFEELTGEQAKKGVRRSVISHSLLFILGFSTLFIILGVSFSYFGHFFAAYRDWIRIAGGILIILFGLLISGVFSLGFMQQEKKFHLQDKPIGYLGSFLVGLTFAAGWTPCVGPILASILLYASTEENVRLGILLLVFYSLGFGLPFFLASLAVNSFLNAFQKIRKYIGVVTKVSGILLILIGVLMLTNSFVYLFEALMRWFPDTTFGL
jgi:cytochrome c-type biogenesis protein